VEASEIRALFHYDRWGTRRVLNAAANLDAAVWLRPGAVGEHGIGGVLVHALAAHARWRHGWQGSPDRPRPELEPVPSPADPRAQWDAEWAELDRYLDGLTDDEVNGVWNGLPLWQTLLHLVNHGTQHRSEAALLLTEAGLSPGELDLLDFVAEQTNTA